MNTVIANQNAKYAEDYIWEKYRTDKSTLTYDEWVKIYKDPRQNYHPDYIVGFPYDIWTKMSSDPNLLAAAIEKCGGYDNYNRALKKKNRGLHKIRWKARIKYFYRHTLPRLAVCALVVGALAFVIFVM